MGLFKDYVSQTRKPQRVPSFQYKIISGMLKLIGVNKMLDLFILSGASGARSELRLLFHSPIDMVSPAPMLLADSSGALSKVGTATDAKC